jgi:hypothetical protein
MNINEWVWVRLTEDGLRHHRPTEYEDVGNGWSRFQMWDLMATYGRHLHLGSGPLFEKNEVHFTKPIDARH